MVTKHAPNARRDPFLLSKAAGYALGARCLSCRAFYTACKLSRPMVVDSRKGQKLHVDENVPPPRKPTSKGGAAAEGTTNLVEGVADVEVSVGVGRAVVQHVLLTRVGLQQSLVDALFVPERLQLGLPHHGVGTLETEIRDAAWVW